MSTKIEEMSDKQYNAVGKGTLLSYDMYYFTPLMKKGDKKMYAELINKAKAIEKENQELKKYKVKSLMADMKELLKLK